MSTLPGVSRVTRRQPKAADNPAAMPDPERFVRVRSTVNGLAFALAEPTALALIAAGTVEEESR